MKALIAVPLGFLLGVFVMALLQVLQVGVGVTTLILVAGFPLLLLFDHWAGRAGNSAILRGFAQFTANPEETRARIDAAEEAEAKTSPFARLLKIAGFAAGVIVCLIWSPSEIIDWVGRRPFF
ncbi:MAG: hypothetical protein AAGA71_02650 [Pseudomonadota bacterium]